MAEKWFFWEDAQLPGKIDKALRIKVRINCLMSLPINVFIIYHTDYISQSLKENIQNIFLAFHNLVASPKYNAKSDSPEIIWTTIILANMTIITGVWYELQNLWKISNLTVLSSQFLFRNWWISLYICMLMLCST